jgi:hypothetical protein
VIVDEVGEDASEDWAEELGRADEAIEEEEDGSTALMKDDNDDADETLMGAVVMNGDDVSAPLLLLLLLLLVTMGLTTIGQRRTRARIPRTMRPC